MSATTSSDPVGEVAPALRVSSWLNVDAPITLDELRGRVVALHAFQMLCPGCVAHGLPQADRIRRTFDPRDVAVIGLHAVFEHHEVMGPRALAAFVHEYRITFPVAIDAPSADGPVPQTMAAYRMRGTPTLVLIDRAGRVRANLFGRPDDLQVGAAIAGLVTARVEAPVTDGCSPDGCAITP